MKATHIIVTSVLCGAVVSYVITRSQYTTRICDLEQARETEVAKVKVELHKDLKRAKQEAGRVEIIETVVTKTVEINPTEVLKELAAIEVNNRNRNPDLRKVIFHLETLANLGPKSIPAMRDFIASGEDVSYGYSYNRTVRVNGSQTNGTVRVSSPSGRYTYYSSSYGNPSSGYLVPPSLRVGLFQVAADVGGDEAERLLVDSLGMAQKGGEAAFLDSLLQKVAPDQYTDLALQVAKDLLINPTKESLNDYQHKSHLYSILTRHRDVDFAKEAQDLLITTDGKLDRYALNYLNTVLKADAVPLLAHAHNDERIKNDWERQSLISYIMRYTGQHPQADQMFLEIMRRPLELEGNKKYYQSAQYTALNSLAYNVDKDTAVKRKALLESVRDNITDANLKRAADSAGKRLEYRITPQSNPWKKQGGVLLHYGYEAGFTIDAEPPIIFSGPAPRQEIRLFTPAGGAAGLTAPLIIRNDGATTMLDLRSLIPSENGSER